MERFAAFLGIVTGIPTLINIFFSIFGKPFFEESVIHPISTQSVYARLLIVILLECAFGYCFGWLISLADKITHHATLLLTIVVLCSLSAWTSVFNVLDILFANALPAGVGIAFLACFCLFSAFMIDAVLMEAHLKDSGSDTGMNVYFQILLACFVIMGIGRALAY